MPRRPGLTAHWLPVDFRPGSRCPRQTGVRRSAKPGGGAVHYGVNRSMTAATTVPKRCAAVIVHAPGSLRIQLTENEPTAVLRRPVDHLCVVFGHGSYERTNHPSRVRPPCRKDKRNGLVPQRLSIDISPLGRFICHAQRVSKIHDYPAVGHGGNSPPQPLMAESKRSTAGRRRTCCPTHCCYVGSLPWRSRWPPKGGGTRGYLLRVTSSLATLQKREVGAWTWVRVQSLASPRSLV